MFHCAHVGEIVVVARGGEQAVRALERARPVFEERGPRVVDQEEREQHGDRRVAEALDQQGGERRAENEQRQFQARQEGLPFQIQAEEQEGGEQSGGVQGPCAIAGGSGEKRGGGDTVAGASGCWRWLRDWR